MSEAMLIPTITDAGLRAALAAAEGGIVARIHEIGLGTGAWSPTRTAVDLQAEVVRLPIASAERQGDTRLHMTALADGAHHFWVREVGFWLEDGTLFAVWSDPATPLAHKSTGVSLLLAFDLILDALPAESIEVIAGPLDLSFTVAEQLAATVAGFAVIHRRQVQAWRAQSRIPLAA